MTKINIIEYIAKYASEFPDGKINSELPQRKNAIAVVSDPQNWHCYPEDVVRIFLTLFDEEIYVIGVGDYEHPTICTKCYETLDEACAFMANRPEKISKKWLEDEGFNFLEVPVSKAQRISS